MGLWERVSHEDVARGMDNHAFAAGIWFLTLGDITRAVFDVAFDIDTADAVDVDAMAVVYNDKATARAKHEYRTSITHANILAEVALVNEAQWRNLVELP